MKTRITSVLLLAAVIAGAPLRADQGGTVAPPSYSISIFDNLFLNAGLGIEKPPGERSTWLGDFGANWGIPLSPREGVAWGLQFGTSLKVRNNDPELNMTFGGFARHFTWFQDQQGAVAALFDYRHTAFHNDVWAFRPILATALSLDDSVGLEGVASLNRERRQEAIDQFSGFWTHDWGEGMFTELGMGYQFAHVDEVLFRGRVAFGLTRFVDAGFGVDVNTDGNYSLGASLSYNFGGTGRHTTVHNVTGRGSELYTPFPAADFPVLFHRTGR